MGGVVHHEVLALFLKEVEHNESEPAGLTS